MAIMPKFKPGQLVEYYVSDDCTMMGLVKTTRAAPRRGTPAFVLVEWCGDHDQKEEYVPQSKLRLVETK